MKQLLLGVVLLLAGYAKAQVHTEKITRELAFEKIGPGNLVIVANINGAIQVEGYDGDKILVEVTKKITAKSEARLQKGISDIQLGVIDRADTMVLYSQTPCNSFGRKEGKRGSRNWGYNWTSNCENCNLDYDYRMEFTLKIPRTASLEVSTINEGDVEVRNVNGAMTASNINGSIRLLNLMREAEAHTINGDVDIEYAQNPSKDCRFYTLNGDINAWFKKGLAANMSFESFNGSFYTNVESLETLPTEVRKENTNEGVRYKINGNRFKVGKGGALLDFETFNGNVYLKER
jgi:hypothetical protein